MMVRFVSSLLLALLLMCCPLSASAIGSHDFQRHWRVESESPDYRVTFRGDTCEILAPQGLTLWRNEPVQTGMAVDYDVQVVDEGRDGDRVSDMNLFWMASDPRQKDIWARANWRSGIFLRCYTLQMYYLGYGGNYNSTTRFRRYDGNEGGVEDASLRPAILKEYTDSAHLLKGNHWYHIHVETQNGRTRMLVDGECIVDYLDPQPLQSGWFGFRTTLSRVRITGVQLSMLAKASFQENIPLHWVGERPSGAWPVCFGVPFAKGELKDVSALTMNCQSPVDTWVTASWPDGSVKWAAVSTVVPADASNLCLVKNQVKNKSRAPMKSAKIAPLVLETEHQLVVTTAALTAYIPKSGQHVMDSLLLNGVKVGGAATLVANNGASLIERVRVERQGNQSAVVRLDGHHSSEGRLWLPFTLRMYFFRDGGLVRMVHSFTYDGDADQQANGSSLAVSRDQIRELGIRFQVPLRDELYNRHVAFATDEGGVWSEPVQPLDGRRMLADHTVQSRQMAGEPLPARDKWAPRDQELLDNWAAWDGFRLSQLTDNAFSLRKRATDQSPWIGTFTGHRAPGYVFVGGVSGGLGVALQDFWQAYPSTLQVDRARADVAELTVWLWSPESEPMNLCHYDTVAHGLQASYEDVQPGMSTPYGIARTSTLWLVPQAGYGGKPAVAAIARQLEQDAHLLPTPQYMYSKRTFGVWSLPVGAGDELAVTENPVEQRLAQYLNYYRDAVEQYKWYGFWNYGDIMHAYDAERHEWRYDVGGYAWDNTELATPMWLWYSFLRTGRHDVWRMAEAMTRHNSEVDTYHIGPFAPLGSRHNVSHWGCGAKEARISQSAFLRFYYYLTGGDERTGELMSAQTDADTLLYHLDPMRLAEPRSLYPCTAPARLRIGPDWLAYAGNWLTEWERTGNTVYRDKIQTGLQSIVSLRYGFFTGNKALGYYPDSGRITFEGDSTLQSTNHLATIMGGFEVMTELLDLFSVPRFHSVWLDYAQNYKQKALEISRNHFPVRRLMAYAAWQARRPELAAEAWHDLWNRIEHAEAPRFSIRTVLPPEVPSPRDEWQGLSTNDAALWSLDAIYMQEVLSY